MVCEKEEILLSECCSQALKIDILNLRIFLLCSKSNPGKTQVYKFRLFYLFFMYFFKNKYLFIMYLAAMTLSCGKWDLVSRPGMEPGPTVLEAWSLSYWTTREVLKYLLAGKFCIAMPVL